jgi:Tfp pilus assembly protein PilN
MTILARIREMGSAAATWWLDQLEMAWPGYRLGQTPGVPPMRLVARSDDEAVNIALIDHGGRELFAERSPWSEYDSAVFDRCLARARARAGQGQLAVSIGIAHAIGRMVMVPRRARPDIDEILRTHICKKTPLRLEEVFLRHVVRVMRDGRLEVRYLVAPRSLIERVLKRLSIPQAQIATLENVPEGDAPTVIVPLASSPRADIGWAGRLALGLAAIILLSVAAGFANSVVRHAIVSQRIERDIAEVRASAPPPDGDQRALYEMEDALVRFGELRNLPGILKVWDDLAQILPASTHLTELTISSHTLQITGYSSSATALIHTIENSLTIHGAVLTAPVIWAHERQKERFSITASLRAPRMATTELE